jgi:hypothetical protein
MSNGMVQELIDDVPLDEVRVRLAENGRIARLFGKEAAREHWRSMPVLWQPAIPALYDIAANGSGEDVLRRILEWSPDTDGKTIADLVLTCSPEALKAGVNGKPSGYPGFMAIAQSHPLLRALFAETALADQWPQALLALPGATRARHPLYFKRITSRAVLVPIELIPNELAAA